MKSMKEPAMKRSATAAMISILLGVLVAVVAPPANAYGPYCGIRWGSLPKDVSAAYTAHLVNVRAGRHACFDRLVIDAEGDIAGYFVRYVDQVRADGSGDPVALRGAARLQVVAMAPDQDNAGRVTYRPANPAELVNVAGWRTFRQVAWAGAFEGNSTVGLGVRARLPFRVFLLDGPGDRSRMVVDVAHRW
jgi:hypothetical protein